MDLHELAPGLTVSGQIEESDIPLLAAKGVRAIICNRPDGEAEGQPPFSKVQAAAAANGIKAVYMPVRSNAITDADVRAFAQALDELPKPMIAYCRSGTRCTALWALGETGKRPVGDILLQAQKAG
ncbi:MAG: TIGR01244 family sulfur transferase, partial [Rhodomicrobium sp.]